MYSDCILDGIIHDGMRPGKSSRDSGPVGGGDRGRGVGEQSRGDSGRAGESVGGGRRRDVYRRF